MAIPTWTSGEVLTASDVNNWFVPKAAFKSAQTTRSSNTQSNDPDLVLTLDASATYLIHADINYSVATGGLGWTWTTPSGTTGAYAASFVLGGTGAGTYGYTWTAASIQAGNQTSPNGGMILSGALTTSTTSGTFAFKWANFTGSNSTTVGAGSILIAIRVG